MWGISNFTGFIIVLIYFLIALFIFYFEKRHADKFHPNFQIVVKKVRDLFLITFVFFCFLFIIEEIQLYNFILSGLIKSIIAIYFLYMIYLVVEWLYEEQIKILAEKGELRDKIKPIYISKRITWFIILVVGVISILSIFKIDYVSFLSTVSILIRSNKYALALTFFLFYLILAKTLLFMFKTYLSNILKRTVTDLDELIIDKIEFPVSLIIILYGLRIMLVIMDNNDTLIVGIINTIIVVIIMVTSVYVLDIIMNELEKKWVHHTKSRLDDRLMIMLHNGIKIMIVLVSILWVFMIWGFDVKSLLLSLGVLSLVLGLALKDSLSNIVGGISLLLDKTFKKGDMIKLQTGETGEVLDVGIRTTKIKTFDDELMIVPNDELANTKIINYAKPSESLRLRISFSVAYGSDIEHVEDVVKKTLMNLKGRNERTEIDVLLTKMGDFALEFEARFHISDYRQMSIIKSNATTEIYRALKKNKIEIPYPTRIIYNEKKRKK